MSPPSAYKPVLVVLLTVMLAAVRFASGARAAGDTYEIQFPLGIDGEQMQIPADNPPTAAKIELGKLLYFDGRMSKDGTVSCATCHDPNKGFTDQQPVSNGIGGQTGARNSPTVINSAFNIFQFWDGRAPSLEEQAKGPIANPIEMGAQLTSSAYTTIANIKPDTGRTSKGVRQPGSDDRSRRAGDRELRTNGIVGELRVGPPRRRNDKNALSESANAG